MLTDIANPTIRLKWLLTQKGLQVGPAGRDEPNPHATGPLSIQLANDDWTLSFGCDAYTTQQTDDAISTALSDYFTRTEVTVTAVAAVDESKGYTDTQLADYSTTAQMTQAISDALVPFGTVAQRDAAISLALEAYYTSTQTDAAIAAGLATIDLTPYDTSAQTDAAIAAAVALSNGQNWTGGPTFNLLRGSNVLRNLSVAGALTASFQNLDDTILIESDSYARSETYTQLETGAAITAAIDALNLSQYRTEAQVLALITGELVPYWDQTEVSTYVAGELANYATSSSVTSAISSALSSYDDSSQVDSKIITALLDFYTRAEVDQQITNALGNVDLSNYYTQAETQSYVASELLAYYPQTELDSQLTATFTQYWTSGRTLTEINDAIAGAGFLTQALADQRYFAVSANASFECLVRTNVTPPMIKALLPRAPLAASTILTDTTLELTCDAYTKAESDGRYLSSSFAPLDARYFARNPAVAEGNGLFHLVQEQFTPNFIRSLLFPPPLTGGADPGQLQRHRGRGGLLEQGPERQPLPAGGDLQLPRKHGHVHRRPGHRPGEQPAAGRHLLHELYGLQFCGDPRAPGHPHRAEGHRQHAAGLLCCGRHHAGPGCHRQCGENPERHHGGLRPAARWLCGGLGQRDHERQHPGRPADRERPAPSCIAPEASLPFLSLSGGTSGVQVLSPLLEQIAVGPPGGTVGTVIRNVAPTRESTVLLDGARRAQGPLHRRLPAECSGPDHRPEHQQRARQPLDRGQHRRGSDGEVICFYGFQNLSDESLKTNLRPVLAEEAQQCFDGVEATFYDRVDGPANQVGFVAQQVEASGTLGKSLCKLKKFEDRELMTLDYQRMTAVLWQVCKSLQRRLEKLEKKKRGRS